MKNGAKLGNKSLNQDLQDERIKNGFRVGCK